MTSHYVATVPVKFTDNDGQERTRFQRVGAIARLPGRGFGAGDVPAEFEGTSRLNPLTRMGRHQAALSLFQGCRHRRG